MRLALLSDIHGNLPALRAALDALKNMQIDEYIFLGDYITDLPWNIEVLSVIWDIKNKRMLRGNREEYMLHFKYGRDEADIRVYEKYKRYMQYNGLVWTYENLTGAAFEAIESLPEKISIDIPGMDRIYAEHGDQVKHTPHIIANICSACYKEAFEDMDAAYLAMGHTHQQFVAESDEKRIFNPGSIGMPLDGRAGFAVYAILEWSEGRWNFLPQYAAYDTVALEKEFKQSGYYRADPIWGDVTVDVIRYGREVQSVFLHYIRDLTNKAPFPVGNDLYSAAVEKWYANKDQILRECGIA